MDHINHGFFNVKNPYNKKVKKVAVSADNVHTIVFWSKNYDQFIKTKAGEKLTRLGFNLYFNFSINSENYLLEPNLPPLEKRLEQLEQLCSVFAPETISWRFDPVCFYQTPDKNQDKIHEENNLSDFTMIAEKASKLGIKKCVTSFLDHYPKIQKRIEFLHKKNHGIAFFVNPSMNRKKKVIQQMEKHLASKGIGLYLCCENQVFSNLDPHTKVLENACVDGNLFKKIFGENPETKRDFGQRAKQGCKCTKSIDIGLYDEHPCFHNCLFCYANPHIDTIIRNHNI